MREREREKERERVRVREMERERERERATCTLRICLRCTSKATITECRYEFRLCSSILLAIPSSKPTFRSILLTPPSPSRLCLPLPPPPAPPSCAISMWSSSLPSLSLYISPAPPFSRFLRSRRARAKVTLAACTCSSAC